eukprot:TRINITY_DN30980_c0_g1_i1.p1 TRINITY_DN30980_c0_g1~~TRINITY_DN30980_c0_g1_i1.p1  ORF type:complete len:928 (+),score=142.48 TRINITY_DN30980_c0_g1_i1:416-2785(+)
MASAAGVIGIPAGGIAGFGPGQVPGGYTRTGAFDSGPVGFASGTSGGAQGGGPSQIAVAAPLQGVSGGSPSSEYNAGVALSSPQLGLGGLRVFGLPDSLVPAELLPEAVVELSITDLDGHVSRCRSARVSSSTDPDVNQILQLVLQPGSKKELSEETLGDYDGQVTVAIFDEVALTGPELGSEVRTRRQRRYLGRFVLPWRTIHASRQATIKGLFCVEQPPILLGYRRAMPGERSDPTAIGASRGPGPAIVGDRGVLGGGTEILAAAAATEMAAAVAAGCGGAPRQQELEAMYVSLSVTVDPVLVSKARDVVPMATGREPRMILQCVEQWTVSLRAFSDVHVAALGTDIEGRSRLVCRFVRPQLPPSHIQPASPFAIEAAARYVSLIPFLSDSSMFPQLTDLWCTDQEFLQIGCGDWEEHAILLCNYFNYIDRYRRARVDGYGTTSIQSYCVLCDVLPDGEIMMVLRRDCNTGHCELWQAVTGECYFVPHRPQQNQNIFQRLMKSPVRAAAEAESERFLRATPSCPLRRVHMVFNAENVWANIQPVVAKHAESGLLHMNFDVENTTAWKPLFVKGHSDHLIRLGLHGDTARIGADRGDGGISDPSGDFRLHDVSQAIDYDPADPIKASQIESSLEEQLEEEIREYRAMGLHGGVQHTTNLNRVFAKRFVEILDDLERRSCCTRRSGDEAVFPLRSHAPLPITTQALQAKQRAVEAEFRAASAGHKGRTVYGVPVNQTFTDFSHLWDVVRDSRVLELGGESAEFAVKVRVYPYESRIFSVWVFLACAVNI